MANFLDENESTRSKLPAILGGGRKRKNVNVEVIELDAFDDNQRRVLAAVQNVRLANSVSGSASSTTSRFPLSTIHSVNNVVVVSDMTTSTMSPPSTATNATRKRFIGSSSLTSTRKSPPASIEPPPAKKIKMRQSWSQ